jgi:folylpolyglutamate synthase
MYDSAAISGLTMQKEFAEKWTSLDPKATVTIVASIEEAIDYVKGLARKDSGDVVQGFITGSLHLIGGALEVLEGADAVVGG